MNEFYADRLQVNAGGHSFDILSCVNVYDLTVILVFHSQFSEYFASLDEYCTMIVGSPRLLAASVDSVSVLRRLASDVVNRIFSASKQSAPISG